MPHQIDVNLEQARECLAAARQRIDLVPADHVRMALSNLELSIEWVVSAMELERAQVRLLEKTQSELKAVETYEQEIKAAGQVGEVTMTEMGHIRLHMAAADADEALLGKVKELERRVRELGGRHAR